MYAFIRLRDETTWDRSLEYIAVTVALLYTHVYGIFIVVAQNLFVLSIALIMKRRAPHLGAWLALQLVVALLFAPWLAVLLTQRANTEAYSWIGAPTISRLLSNFSGYTGGSLSLALVFALCSLGAVLTWKTARGAFKWKTPLQSLLQYRWVIGIAADYKVYLAILWLLIPNLLPFIYSYISAPICSAARFTIPASMALYVLAAKGIASVRQIAFKLGVMAVIVALSMTSIASYYAQPRDDTPYKAIAAYVDENAQPGDLMLFINRPTADHISRIDQRFDAYSKRTDLHKVPFPATFYDMSREEQLQTLNATVQHQSRIWVFYVDGWDYLFNESALGSAGMDCQNAQTVNSVIKSVTVAKEKPVCPTLSLQPFST